MIRCPLEADEQKHLIAWAAYMNRPDGKGKIGTMLFAIPNGGSRSRRRGVSLEALELKRQGVKPGVPDLFLAIAAGPYHGLFIEMKRAVKSASTVSAEQKAWKEALCAEGYASVIAYGADAAKEAIKTYLSGGEL
ncbi:MAG: VRR-NUC domain-containing protein [Succinivibrio sp.]|nr:VRR-NUC domain-containing protein [Succinivibrio sp.]